MRKRLLPLAVVAASAIALTGCSAGASSSEKTTVTVRLWDSTVAKAYKTSFAAFEKENPDVDVKIDVVPWADYWTDLRTDVAGMSAPDVFWVNNSYFGAYADSGSLLDVGKTLGDDAQQAWSPTVVKQFTRDGKLWAVPQLSDAGIAVYYNKTLLDAAKIAPKDLDDLTWSPDATKDTFLPIAKRLTKDAAGVTADQPGFDPATTTQYGTNIAYDLQAILLPYIGSNGGTFQNGDDFAFAEPKTEESISYLVNAINTAKVAPPAADTTANGDFSRDAFVQGKIAMFQSGLYNLKNISENAKFDWGVARIPAGPAGAVSVTNGIAAAGNAATKHPDAVKKLLAWMGSKAGNAPIGADGAAVPAVKAAQKGYFSYWKREKVDVQPFFDVIAGKAKTIPAPQGARFDKGLAAYDPILASIFAGTTPVPDGLKKAQEAANSALND
ncbi:ABC transporter substrate-binding protein [Plantibacter sp. YIM 135347]|uniref:ABC transporter substrate-binding protein n=1 Tax=Plantibacter sp. YIM 135347 TaxID=3423919 RepID=UPI003D33BFF1